MIYEEDAYNCEQRPLKYQHVIGGIADDDIEDMDGSSYYNNIDTHSNHSNDSSHHSSHSSGNTQSHSSHISHLSNLSQVSNYSSLSHNISIEPNVSEEDEHTNDHENGYEYTTEEWPYDTEVKERDPNYTDDIYEYQGSECGASVTSSMEYGKLNVLKRDEIEPLRKSLYFIFLLLFIAMNIALFIIFYYFAHNPVMLGLKLPAIFLMGMVMIIINSFLCKSKFKIKILYTRKIHYFLIYGLSSLLSLIFSTNSKSGKTDNYDTLILYFGTFVLFFVHFGIFFIPVRHRFPCIDKIYDSFDRPEDRPYTLTWYFVQHILYYMNLIGFLLYIMFSQQQKGDEEEGSDKLAWLTLIAPAIVCVGGGLGDVIGTTFGKFKFRVRNCFGSLSLFSEDEDHDRDGSGNGRNERIYTKSLECLFVVYMTGVLVVTIFQLLFGNDMFESFYKFLFCLIFVPIVAALTEAWVPPTVDAPLMMFTINLCLTVIIFYVHV